MFFVEIISVELKNKKAISLLKELEDIGLIRLLSTSNSRKITRPKPSQLKGFLPEKTANTLLKHIEKSRNEWESRSTS